MKRVTILMVLLFLGCGALRKQETSLKNTEKTQMAVQKTHLVRQNWNSITNDSLFSETDVVFWPKGLIKISGAGAFEGEINKIQIRTKESQRRKIAESGAASQKLSSTTGYKAAQQNLQTVKSQSGGNSRHLAWGIGLLIVAGVFVFRWLRNR